METQRIGNWFQTYTGKACWLMDPRPDEICIEDIAHALALQCRFNGHVTVFYSVAQHSVFVSEIVPKPFALAGLMHDATEAYLGDMVKPLKWSMPAYRTAEKVFWRVIAAKFGLHEKVDPAVKVADLVALATERRDLMSAPPLRWPIDELQIEPHPNPLNPLASHLAEQFFLDRYRELTGI